MPGILVSLLIAVLCLVLFQYLLDAVGLSDPAKKVLWVIAVVLAIIYVLDPSILPH